MDIWCCQAQILYNGSNTRVRSTNPNQTHSCNFVLSTIFFEFMTQMMIMQADVSHRAPCQTAQDFSTQILNQEKARANARQDEIAKAMWRQYQEYLAKN